ncbi:MAG TPA: glycoside hydrolase family 65 protein [bacterium]|nr:glycoside hydrolase family 65 protein [bacterium]
MNEWKVIYDQFIPEHQPLREALCALGNGYFVTRGAAEESNAGGCHYPGTYLAGGYNRLKSKIAGRTIENEDLVNWPNWLCLTFRPEGGVWFDLETVEILDFKQEFNLQTGVLSRKIRFRDGEGRETSVLSRRFVHLDKQHLAAIEWVLTPENWSGKIQLRSALNGKVTNSGVERYSALNGNHLEFLESDRIGEDGIYLLVQTTQSKIQMAQAARTCAFQDGKPVPVKRQTVQEKGLIAQELNFECHKQKSVRIEKIISLYTSRDRAISEAGLEARTAIQRAGGFTALLKTHKQAWSRLWHRCDIELCDGNQAQPILRLHIFHLLQTASENTIDLDVGIPARGWHGEAYRGHIFWDELFIFPFLNFRIPELSRALLMYRYRRLPEARHFARQAGYKGAMYPWQSGSNGREESQVVHLNPKSGKWHPDNTHLQRHVNAAIVYNICHYYEATNDMHFMSFYGAEMMLEIARFWASIATFVEERDRFEIHNVVGPDEFHTQYPDSDEPGLKNNAYTNVMAAWVLQKALRVLNLLAKDRRAELLAQLGINDKELEQWEHISRKMFVPLHDGDIISQFEGYEKLDEFDWEKYRNKYGDIQRLDRILKAEGDSPNHYKAGKQADVLMLFYLFSAEELQQTFERLGYKFDPDSIPRNIEYYAKRSSHGSTLSHLVYSWVLSRSDREQSWKYFLDALKSDFEDVQGGTTPEGVHLGAMAGTVDMVQRCYTGLEIREDVLWINPMLPKELGCIKMRICYRGHWVRLNFDSHQVTVSFESGWSPEVRIGFKDQIHTFGPGETQKFNL